MSKVSSNNVSLAYAVEESIGVLPASPIWKGLEPNSIGKFGAEITTVARNPMSANRQRQKGTVTDLESGVEFEQDLTMEIVEDFVAAFCFASPVGPAKFGPLETDDVTAVTSTGYTVEDNGDLPNNTLIYARGFTTAANNGLKVTAGTSTTTEIKCTGLVAEASPPAAATVEVCGVRGASGDIVVNASGNLASTTLDFTTLDLNVGQFIWVGGITTGTSFAQSANRGFARILAIAAHVLTLDKKATTFVADTGTGKTIDLFFGKFIRNVSVDDTDYLEQSVCFEGSYPDLEAAGTPAYEYARGNYCNEITVNLPLADKATVGFNFVGTDTDDPTAVRETNADEALPPVMKEAFNTSADIGRMRITGVDESGLSTYFKTVSLTIKNNVSPEKVLGVLGAAFMNTGKFEVDVDATMLFTNKAVPAAIRANTTVTMDFAVRNNDGAIFFDLPAVTLGDGTKEYPENESVTIKTPAMAFEHSTLGTSIGVSLFPYAPTA